MSPRRAFAPRRMLLTASLAAALALCAAPAALGDDGALADWRASAEVSLRQATEGAQVPATLTEEELDQVVGLYAWDGEVVAITARDAIEDAVSLQSVQNEDGTYAAPTADMVLTYARNRILASVVAREGIAVSEDELADYALNTIGTSDFAAIAQYYSMTEEQARRILEEGACLAKLRDREVGALGAAPQPPTAPGTDMDAQTKTEVYADYVTGLAGDAWDAQAGVWSDTASAFYQALGASEFDGQTASYEQAQIAYYVAYSLYEQQAAEQLAAWTDYVNGYLGQAAITVATLRA